MYRFHGLFKRFELFSRGIIRKIWNTFRNSIYSKCRNFRLVAEERGWNDGNIYIFSFFFPLQPSLDKQKNEENIEAGV